MIGSDTSEDSVASKESESEDESEEDTDNKGTGRVENKASAETGTTDEHLGTIDNVSEGGKNETIDWQNTTISGDSNQTTKLEGNNMTT